MAETPPLKPPVKSSWAKRVAWLVGLWVASILVLSVLAFGLKFVMRAVGFHI